MRTNAHQPKMKLSLTNKPCSLLEWRIPTRLFNETSSDFNFKNKKLQMKIKIILFILLFFFIVPVFSQGVVVNGGLFILQPTAQVIITSNGNWTNNATVTCNTGSWVRMAGNAIQTIQGANTTVFSNVDINSTTSVFVGRDITINDNLQLTAGYFDLRNAITYLGNTSGNVTGGETETKRIRATTNAGGTDDGNGIGTIRTTRTNPNGNIANLGLDFNGSTLGSTTIIRGHKVQTGSGSFTGNSSIYRYYEIVPTTQANTTINHFYYFDAELGSQASYEADLEMFQWVKVGSPQWWMPRVKTGSNTTTNYVASTTTTNELTTYKITLASTDKPLPIELLSFDAMCTNHTVTILWSTASEMNNHHFTLERSCDDMNHFITIATIQGAGNSSSLKTYSFIDTDYQGDRCYYRLSQTDNDGVSTTFNTIAASCELNTGFNFHAAYPNPTSHELNILFTDNNSESVQIVITNVLGQQFYTKEIVCEKGLNTVTLDLSNYSSGVYFLELTNGKKSFNKKVIKSY